MQEAYGCRQGEKHRRQLAERHLCIQLFRAPVHEEAEPVRAPAGKIKQGMSCERGNTMKKNTAATYFNIRRIFHRTGIPE
ncbi:MAG: hypothetical protein LUF25_04530 [Phascolarctobacterium sp.]|nr:hypothetical protein [Phascolarctobacterium sp.]